MKDLIIITDIPITYESCSKIIKSGFKNLLLFNDDSESLYMKKSSRGFELWFSPNDQLDNPDFFMDSTIEKCPNKKAFLTNLCYTSKSIAKNLITLIKPMYGNMWIQSDEEDDWFGTVDEFLEIYCKNV